MNVKLPLKVYNSFLKILLISLILITISVFLLVTLLSEINVTIIITGLLLLFLGLWILFIGFKNRKTPLITVQDEGLSSQSFKKYGMIPWHEIKNLRYEIVQAGRSTQYYLYVDVFHPEDYQTEKQKAFRKKHPLLDEWRKSFNRLGEDTAFTIPLVNIKRREQTANQIIEVWQERRKIVPEEEMFDNRNQLLNDGIVPAIIKSEDTSNFKYRLWTLLIVLAILLVGFFGYFQKKAKTQNNFMVNKNYLVIDENTKNTEFGFKLYPKITKVPLAFIGNYVDFSDNNSQNKEIDNWKFTFKKMSKEHISDDESFDNKVVRMVTITAIKNSKSKLVFEFKHKEKGKQIGGGDEVTGWDYAQFDNINLTKEGYTATLNYKEDGDIQTVKVLVLEEKDAFHYLKNK
ncbi:STM3941 family protein [Lactococcus lactis]|nr:STM3941 family protein [Lactococcus lactis]